MGERGLGAAQAWLHARAHLAPHLLIQAHPWVRAVFDHAWAPMTALAQQIRALPDELWGYLLGCDGGQLLIGTEESRYVPGLTTVRYQSSQNAVLISVEDLAADNERPLHVLGHLIDHYLGCGGALDGPWLSEGGGARPDWQAAGRRLPGLFALGYGVDEVAQAGVRDYFAQSLALCCRDRQRLNVADPQIDKWFHSTLWSKTFWRTSNSEEESNVCETA